MNRLELRHILCPIDFSPLSAVSLATASAMAGVREAEVRAIHVVPSEVATAGRRLGSFEHRTILARLRAALSEAAPTYERTGAAAKQGDPATQILQFARALPADLIVMGAPGANRPERPMGPVAAVVIVRSQCPVLAVPAHPRQGASRETGLFSRIVCAVDLTPSSAGVIRQALSVAWETKGQLTYVCVADNEASTSPSTIRDGLLAAVPTDASGWCDTDVIVTTGIPSAEIVRIADDVRADVVVIGAPRRWTSTTHAVLSRSLCPVLVTHDARPLPWPAARIARESEVLGMNRSRY